MSAKLFVASLAYSVTEEELNQLFGEAGTVVSAKVIFDRDTGKSKGFAFVEMSSEAEAQAAIRQLHGKEQAGRSLIVNLAKPQTDRPERPAFRRSNGYR
jgi:cold-inducible RNA-binding protein